MTNPTPNSLSPQGVPNNSARCLGTGSDEDGEWHWREGCDDCQRRILWAGEDWIDPPPIIAFECEYRIGPDEIVAQGEHAPGPKPLSPAAQKILDALGVQGVTALELVARGIAAAAIRTAADQLINVKWSVEMWELHHELHAIATELED